jgi:catalase (peroxidase I)
MMVVDICKSRRTHHPDPKGSGGKRKNNLGRMAMNDEETYCTRWRDRCQFGKVNTEQNPNKYVGSGTTGHLLKK